MGAPGMNFNQNGQTGTSSGRVSIEHSLIEGGKPNAGQRNGVKIENEYVTVWRYNGCGVADDCDPYELVYMATRTPVFAPVNGVTNFDRPAKMWAGKVASTEGSFLGKHFAKTPQAGHHAVSGWGLPRLIMQGTTQNDSTRNGLSGGGTQNQDGADIAQGDISYEDVADGTLPVFDNVNLSRVDAGLYERSVLGKIDPLKLPTTVAKKLESTPPNQSLFKEGDTVVVSQFTKGDGRDPNSYGVSANYTCDLKGTDGKVDLQNPTCKSSNGGKALDLNGLKESIVPANPANIDPNNSNWQSEEAGIGAERMTLPSGASMTREDANADPVLQGSQQLLGVGQGLDLEADFSVVPDIPDPISDAEDPQTVP
jgi:hypothetical protein